MVASGLFAGKRLELGPGIAEFALIKMNLAELHADVGKERGARVACDELAGQAALDVFTEWKSLYIDFSGKLQRAQIDNA